MRKKYTSPRPKREIEQKPSREEVRRQAEATLITTGRKIHQWFMDREKTHPNKQGIVHYKGLNITYSPKTKNYYLCNKIATCYYDMGFKDVTDLLLTYAVYMEKNNQC